ncbi:MAG: hypothetical protein ACLGI6_07135, partial [Gammaproteobacteria bacterium]
LSYNGVLKGTSKLQYWLYDRQSHAEHLIYETPPWRHGLPEFSPDSRYLVLNPGYDSRWIGDSRAGIHLLDTATMRLQRVRLPVLKAQRTKSVSTTWSQDGKELLIVVMNDSANTAFEYFSYSLATRQIDAVAGRYNREVFRHEFARRGQAVPAFEKVMPRSYLAERSAWSPGGNWHAHLDGNQNREGSQSYQLLVTSKAGVARPIATGHYEHCAGNTLFITGWLDDRHLVYRNSMNYVVFDAQTGTTADLFGQNDMGFKFTW